MQGLFLGSPIGSCLVSPGHLHSSHTWEGLNWSNTILLSSANPLLILVCVSLSFFHCPSELWEVISPSYQGNTRSQLRLPTCDPLSSNPEHTVISATPIVTLTLIATNLLISIPVRFRKISE